MKKIIVGMAILFTINVCGMQNTKKSSIQIRDYNSDIYEKIQTIPHNDFSEEQKFQLRLNKGGKIVGESSYSLYKTDMLTNSGVAIIYRDYFLSKEKVLKVAQDYTYLLFLESIEIGTNYRRFGLASDWIVRSLSYYFREHGQEGKICVILRVFPYGNDKLTFNQTISCYTKLGFQAMPDHAGANKESYFLVLDKDYFLRSDINFGTFKVRKIAGDIKINCAGNLDII